jgi:hypothetical protein
VSAVVAEEQYEQWVPVPFLLIAKDRDVKITVDYRYEPRLGFMVPLEMRESYRPRMEGRARYSDFRKFDTSARLLDE